MVYLNVQPFRYHAFNIHTHLMLITKYYGPFKILEKIGPTTYILQLLPTVDIHHAFHVTWLKKHIGPQANLPLVTPDG
jgi:hypothetical protein